MIASERLIDCYLEELLALFELSKPPKLDLEYLVKASYCFTSTDVPLGDSNKGKFLNIIYREFKQLQVEQSKIYNNEYESGLKMYYAMRRLKEQVYKVKY